MRLERAALAGDERALDELHALDVMRGYRALLELHHPDRPVVALGDEVG